MARKKHTDKQRQPAWTPLQSLSTALLGTWCAGCLTTAVTAAPMPTAHRIVLVLVALVFMTPAIIAVREAQEAQGE